MSKDCRHPVWVSQVFHNNTPSGVVIRSGHRLWNRSAAYLFQAGSIQVEDEPSEIYRVEDRFTFRVFDSWNASSTIGAISLVVESGLTALTTQSQNDSSWIFTEDIESIIHVYARDYAECPRQVIIIISAIPVHGQLLLRNCNRTLEPGDEVTTHCEEGCLCSSSINYRPERDYFNYPSISGNASETEGTDRFKFYAVANASGEFSNEITQDIRVMNVNDPTYIQCPGQGVYVQPMGTTVYSPTASLLQLDRAVLHGFDIVDPDNGADVVKVKVSAYFGLVSLNCNNVSQLDFTSSTHCYKDNIRRCSGSGSSDFNMTFVASPSHALTALNGMVYQSLASGVVDEIEVTVFDGASRMCLLGEGFQSDSSYHGCWRRSCSVRVTVSPRADTAEQLSASVLPPQVWICLGVGMMVVVYVVRQIHAERRQAGEQRWYR